jgi:hypothetical protein
MIKLAVPLRVLLFAIGTQTPQPLVPDRITRIEVSVGDDSCYVAPITDSASIEAVVRFINSRVIRVDSPPPWGLGGVHAELYSDGRLVAFFGVGLARRGFEFNAQPRVFRTWRAPVTELDEFLRLLMLPPGTNAGLGLPGYCSRPKGSSGAT